MSNVLRGIRNIIRGCLMAVALVVSSIALYVRSQGDFTTDVIFCVWCICIVQFIDTLEYFDNKGNNK